MPQFGDDIYLGPANAGGQGMESATVLASALGPSPMATGVGPLGRVYIFDVQPLTLQTSGLAVAQPVAGAGNLTLTAGTGVTTSVDAAGVTRYVLDTPRCLSIDSANAGDTTQTATFYGYDLYNQPMTFAITLNGTTEVYTTKAFKSVYRIAISAATAGNINAGFNDKLGLPVRVANTSYVVNVKWAAVLAADAGTFVAADLTSPATSTTTDVRGCYTPTSAADGSRRLIMTIALPALAVGPNATRIGAFGVTQA
jgi:hypothetical protein